MNSLRDTTTVRMIAAARSTTLDESLSFILVKQPQRLEQQTMVEQKSLKGMLGFNIF
jgi:hypothetical protein